MSNIIDLPRKGKHPPSDNDNAAGRLCQHLDLAAAEHVALLEFRLRRRDFERTRTLDAEVRLVEARDSWSRAFAALHGVAAGSCALWGLVAARIDFHRLSESRPRANGNEPTYIETMTTLEQGGAFTPTTRELEFSNAASATTEWWPG